MSDAFVIEGGCLCGATRFGLTELPRVAGYCHCTRCQRRTGTGSSVSASVDAATFELLTGSEALGGWQPPDDGNEKFFCASCGAHVFSRSRDGARMSVRMGVFDSDPGVRPSFRQYLAYAPAWDTIPDDGLAHFDEKRTA